MTFGKEITSNPYRDGIYFILGHFKGQTATQKIIGFVEKS